MFRVDAVFGNRASSGVAPAGSSAALARASLPRTGTRDDASCIATPSHRHTDRLTQQVTLHHRHGVTAVAAWLCWVVCSHHACCADALFGFPIATGAFWWAAACACACAGAAALFFSPGPCPRLWLCRCFCPWICGADADGGDNAIGENKRSASKTAAMSVPPSSWLCAVSECCRNASRFSCSKVHPVSLQVYIACPALFCTSIHITSGTVGNAIRYCRCCCGVSRNGNCTKRTIPDCGENMRLLPISG